ncbi:MAG: CHASE3 domain-containing protein [Pyrinomonadaceae bacterium]
MQTTHPRPSTHADPATFRRRLTLAVLLPLVLMAVLAGLFLWQISRLLSASQWVEHTDKVIARANSAHKSLIDMETGMRGYLITGKPEFLEPYERAAREIDPAFAALGGLVSDNPAQVRRLDEIRSQSARWIDYGRSVIALRNGGGDYQARVSSGEGKRLMDAARAQFASFIGAEEMLRDERTQTTRRAALLAVGTGVTAALLFGLALVAFIRRQLVAVSRSYAQALETEREQRQWLGTTLASIGDAVIATDAAGRVILMNGVAESVTGWKMDEAAGRPLPEVFRIVNEETRREVESPVAKVLREGQIVGLANHTVLIAKDGGETPIDDSGAPIKDEEGNITGVVLVFRDIAERKGAEEELRRKEAELRDFVERAAMGLHWVGPDGTIKWANQMELDLLGYTAEEYIGHNISEFHADQEVINNILHRLTAGETIINYEARLRCKDNSLRYVLINSNVRWENDQFIHTRCFTRDITEIKRIELEREQMFEREKTLRAEAEEANRLKDEFLATASHELRTPLTAVVGWTRMLRAGNLDETTSARALETIERNANAQTKLIEDLLDISRIITGKLMLDTQPVEVAPIVSAAVNTVRPAADAKNIEVEMIIDSRMGPVLADANRLQQVVWNLLSNAVKFTPKEGRVIVRLRPVDSQVEISVRDTGEGIDPEFLPYVFDRFRQQDGRTTRKHGGLGLGLAIVRNLVEMHGGTVKAHSEGRGRGATFGVRLPLLGLYSRAETPAMLLAREETEATRHLGIDCQPNLDGLRVLVVDDDVDTREMLKAVLSQCEAEVIAVASAAEALQEIERRKPDVLISDIGMPVEDGYELIKKVRAMEAGQGVQAMPALALTAYAKAEDRVRALAAGYQVQLSKPVEPAEFALVVANLVSRGNVAD